MQYQDVGQEEAAIDGRYVVQHLLHDG